MRILVVEDETKLNKGIVKGLQNEGFAVDFAYDGLAGETLARRNEYDAIVLDVMMPQRDGLTVCLNLREAHITTPVLFLTAKDSVADRVSGLNGGGDDYLVKPFAMAELVARLRALLRRPPQTVSTSLSLDGLQLNTTTHRLIVEGNDIPLTLREYALLEYLLRNVGRPVSRQEILDHVWDTFYDAGSNVVDVHLKNIRKKLPSTYAKRITTIRGQGYQIA